MTSKKRKATKLIQRVANNIKYYRKERKQSQEKLEDETGLTISRYESGKHDMTLTTLSILSKHLLVEIYQLLEEKAKLLIVPIGTILSI